MKPIIGIVISVGKHDKDLLTLESSYMHLVERTGGIPILFSIHRKGLVPHKELLSIIDGIILTGSFILKDKIVNEKLVNPNLTLRNVNAVCYDYCLKLIKLARKKHMPVIGICRGYATISGRRQCGS